MKHLVLIFIAGTMMGVIGTFVYLYHFWGFEAGTNIHHEPKIRASKYVEKGEYWISFKTSRYFGDHLEYLGVNNADPTIKAFLVNTNGLASFLMSNGEFNDLE